MMKHTRQAGFTITELLVAVSITMLMLFVVNQLFFTTSEAVSRGTALADIIGNTRAAVNQIDDDARKMIGPHGNEGLTLLFEENGGILMIVNRVVTGPTGNGVELAKPHGPDEPGDVRQGTSIFRNVRSDQLVFLRLVGDAFNISPSSSNSFTPGQDNGLAIYARVIYGHGRRPMESGADPTGGVLGNTLVPNGGSPLDSVANNWILTRQMLFLGENTITVPGGTLPSYHANGGWFNAPVVGMGTLPAGVPPALYMGLTDYAYFSFDNPAHTRGCLVGLTDVGGTNPTFRLGANMTYPAYRTRAIVNYTFAQQRLRVNPAPAGGTYDAWQIAQMHPFFVEGVSDFIVEFAADIENNTTGAAALPAGPDGEIDVVRGPAGTGFPAGNDSNGRAYPAIAPGQIKWYASEEFENNPLNAATYDSTKPLVFRTPAPAAYPPYEDNDGAANHFDGGFVWRHDDEWATPATPGTGKFLPGNNDQSSLWPYLIRMRYRMHDQKGKVKSGDGVHGMWFEQVLRVARPPTAP